MRTRHFFVVLAAVALGLAGCDSSSSSEPEPAAATTKPPAPARYDTPQALIAALEQKGVQCGGYDPTEGVIGAVGRGSCYMDGQEVVVSVYATKADAEGEPQRKHELLAGVSEVTMVVGENWTASCDQVADCRRIEAATGGRLVQIPA